MRKMAAAGVLVFALAPLVLASSADKDASRLDKELKKISLAATDDDGRRVVNRVMAEQLGVSRRQLVTERKQTGFVYGQIFAAHLVAKQASMEFNDVASMMKKGQSLLAISETKNLELQPMLTAAKKMNKALNSELDKVADGEEDEQADDNADGYDPSDDSQAGDTSNFSPSELAQAKSAAQQRAQAARAANASRSTGTSNAAGTGRGWGAGSSVSSPSPVGAANRGRGPGR